MQFIVYLVGTLLHCYVIFPQDRAIQANTLNIKFHHLMSSYEVSTCYTFTRNSVITAYAL